MNQQYFPMGYQHVVPQQYQYQPSVQRKVDFVQGRASAEVYPVNSGEEVILIDMDNPFVYRKARGFDNKLEPMQTFDLIPHVEKTEELPKINLDGYVKVDEIEGIVADAIEKKMSELTLKPTPKRTKKAEDDE